MDNIETFNTQYGFVTLYKNELFIGNVFKENKYWKEDILLKVKEYINPDRNILEIGGHCGTSSIVYSTFLNSNKNIFVYEPQVNMYNLLLQNINQNNLQTKIIPHNLGIFCYKGIGVMNSIDLDGCGSEIACRYGPGSAGCNFGGICLGTDGEIVNLTTVDDLNLDNIGFIHCCAQGSESFIFSKATQTIQRHRPVILYENLDFYGSYLYDNVRNSYPEYEQDGRFDIKKYCMEVLNYSNYIDRFDGGIDTLLIP